MRKVIHKFLHIYIYINIIHFLSETISGHYERKLHVLDPTHNKKKKVKVNLSYKKLVIKNLSQPDKHLESKSSSAFVNIIFLSDIFKYIQYFIYICLICLVYINIIHIQYL